VSSPKTSCQAPGQCTDKDFRTASQFACKQEDKKDWLFDISNESMSEFNLDENEQELSQPAESQDNINEELYSSFKVQKGSKTRTHYKCEVDGCGKEFTQICNVKRHLLIHLNIKEFHCKNCNKTFSQKANMQRHEKNCLKGKARYSSSDKFVTKAVAKQ